MSRSKVPSARPIDAGLPVRDELRRVMRDELRLVVDACGSYSSWQLSERGVAVRRARKSLKRFRAALDLARLGIEPADHEALRVPARELGRRLSPLRDRDVVHDLLQRLEKEASTSRRREAVRLAGILLAASRPEIMLRDHRNEERIVTEVGAEAGLLVERVEATRFEKVDRSVVLDRIERMWMRARSRFHGDLAKDDTEWIHESRKRVIRLQLGLQPLVTIEESEMPRLVKRLRKCADAFGDDHDLAILRDLVEEHAEQAGDREVVRRVQAEIDQRRSVLQQDGRRRGLEALRPSPGEARRQLKRWWDGIAVR